MCLTDIDHSVRQTSRCGEINVICLYAVLWISNRFQSMVEICFLRFTERELRYGITPWLRSDVMRLVDVSIERRYV